MPEGRVIQSVGGFQTVLSPEGRPIVGVTTRGRVKRSQGEIVVGDMVEYTTMPEVTVIEAIKPRRNLLRRPLVANIDQAVLVFALQDPAPSDWLIDRFIVAISAAGLPIILCLNKVDLVKPKEARELVGITATSACARLKRVPWPELDGTDFWPVYMVWPRCSAVLPVSVSPRCSICSSQD